MAHRRKIKKRTRTATQFFGNEDEYTKYYTGSNRTTIDAETNKTDGLKKRAIPSANTGTLAHRREMQTRARTGAQFVRRTEEYHKYSIWSDRSITKREGTTIDGFDRRDLHAKAAEKRMAKQFGLRNSAYV